MTAYAQYTPVAIPAYGFNELKVSAAAAHAPGDLYTQADGTVCFYTGLETAVVSDPAVFTRTGAFWVLCNATSDTYNAGDRVFWLASSKRATMTIGAGCFLGTAVLAKVSGTTRVLVQINNQVPGAASTLGATTVTTLAASGAVTLSSTVAYAGLGTYTNAGVSFLYGTGAAAAASGVLIGGGTTANPCTTAVADVNFVELRCRSTATSGTGRLAYLRYALAGAGGSGEALRAYTDLTAAMAAGTSSHGAHISIQVSTTGYVAGEAAGVRGQLYVKSSPPAGGTYYAMMAEMYFDASASIASPTQHAILAIQAAGDATAAATCLNAIAFAGGADSGGGQMISPGTSMSTVTGTIRILVNGAVRYLPYYSHEGHA